MKIEATKDECHEAYFRFLGLKSSFINSNCGTNLVLQKFKCPCFDIEPYHFLSAANGHYNSIHTNSISYDDFNNGGSAIFAFDLTTNAVSDQLLIVVVDKRAALLVIP